MEWEIAHKVGNKVKKSNFLVRGGQEKRINSALAVAHPVT
jgi:hypothetical protein